MKKLLYIFIATMAASLLGGCLNDIGNFGSSAAPPTAFTATAGDGKVKLTWSATAGVEYWLFSATDAGLTAFNWANLPNAYGRVQAMSPFYMCGLYSGIYSPSGYGNVGPTYYFAANGRINGGPGGASSPTISATPYNASANWHAGSAPLSSQNIYGVGYTGLSNCANKSINATGSFVAAGANGTILVSNSYDGLNVDPTWNAPIWNTPGNVSPAFDLYAVAGYTANINNPATQGLRWVAVGAGEGSVYSTDGINWYIGRVADLTLPTLHSLTQFAGTFFAAGDAGTILSSTDGSTWTAHTSNTTNNLRGITHGNVYAAVGDGGTLLTSGDGSTWTTQTSVASLTASNLRQVTSSGNIIVAVGDNGTIVTSINGGSTWTTPALSGTPVSGTPNLVGVTAESQFVMNINAVVDPKLGFISNAQFVAVDSTGNTYTSTNGLTWQAGPVSGISSLSNLGQPIVGSGFGYIAAGNAGAAAYAF